MKCYSKVFFTEFFINKFIFKRGFLLLKAVFNVNYYLYCIYPQFYPHNKKKKEYK